MNTLVSYLRIPFLAASGLATLGSGLLYFRQNDIIYPSSLPAGSRTQVPTPQDFRIQPDFAESVYIDTPDGERLHAYYLQPPNPNLRKNVTIICFHGNAGNVGHRLPIGKVLSESLGCNVLMLEYRGYGLSTGSADEIGLSIDGQAALDFVRNHERMGRTQIVLYGQSLGGAVAIKTLAENQRRGLISGVVLENTFLSIRKLIPTLMPPARYISMLCHQIWNSEQVIQKVSPDGPPILFLSGLKDEIVPPSMMRTLYKICRVQRKHWTEFPNGDHNSSVAEKGYFDAIWQFLQEEILSEKDNLVTAELDVEKDKLRTEPSI